VSTQKAVSALIDRQSSGFSWGMIFSENRFPLFGIMPYDPAIAPVAELVDAPDSKSGDGNIVLVRSRPGAPAYAAKQLRLASQSAKFLRRPISQP
jgi:hypothetical protein